MNEMIHLNHFMHLLDLAIEYGDINYIKYAIDQYSNILNADYINNANNIVSKFLKNKLKK